MGIVVAGLTLAYLLVVWFKTDAFIEYSDLFRLSKWFKIDEYMEMDVDKEEDSEFSYHKFLTEYYPSFFTRLVTCPICISIWLALPLSWLYGVLSAFIAVAFIGLSLYAAFAILLKWL